MKNLTLIVHANAEQALADLLRSLPAVCGFTFTHVEDHGLLDEENAELSARDLVEGYVPRARVDLILNDADVNVVLTALRKSHIGLAGRGRYWITPVEAGTL